MTDLTKFCGVLGGGGRPHAEGLAFLEAAIDLSGAEDTKLLVVPTAKTDPGSDGGASNLTTALGLNANQVRLLHPVAPPAEVVKSLTLDHVLDELHWATVVYFAGGDTPRLVSVMNQLTGAINALTSAFCEGGKIACGISVGMLCWFDSAQSDTQSYRAAPGHLWNYQMTGGWNLIPAIGAAHYDRFHPLTHEPRSANFRQHISRQEPGTIGIALTNYGGLQFNRGRVSVINSEPYPNGAMGRCFQLTPDPRGKDYVRSRCFSPGDGEFPLSELLTVTA